MQLSHNKPAKKQEAYKLITSLKEGKTLTVEEVDSLLLYFHPPKNKVAKTAMEWVSLAVAINDVRFYLNYVYVHDGIATGTDGHRLHRAKVDLPNGYYCPKTLLPVQVDQKYVSADSIQRVMQISGSQRESMAVKDSKVVTIGGKKPFKAYELANQFAYNAVYVDDAVNRNHDLQLTFSLDRAAPLTDQMKAIGESEFGDFVIVALRS